MENLKELEFKTHMGEFWKCKPSDVLEIFPGIMKLGVFEKFDYCARVKDPTGKYNYHVWGITEKTARWLSESVNIKIGAKVDFKIPDSETLEQTLRKIKEREEGTEKIAQVIPDMPKEALRLGLNNFFKDFSTGEVKGAS